MCLKKVNQIRFIFGSEQEKIIVVPCQAYYSIEEFRKFAQISASSSEHTDCENGNEFFVYRFCQPIQNSKEQGFLFAKAGQRRILGKQELWHKYVGPKCVEVILSFKENQKKEAFIYLDKLMGDLCIEEYCENNEKGKEQHVQGMSAVDDWYKKRYDALKDIEEKINEALKDLKL